MGSKKINLAIIGDYPNTSDFSNTTELIKCLTTDDRFQVLYQYGKDNNKTKINLQHSLSRIFLQVFRKIFSSLLAGIQIKRFSKLDVDIIYVPYISLVPLFIYSLLNRNRKSTKIIADGLISIYDTVVNDRKLLKKHSIVAKILLLLEKRSFESAEVILVDTLSNALFYSRTLNIPANKFIQIPLFINEGIYKMGHYIKKNEITVLFAGGFIPLHGIETIVKAAKLLQENNKIHFKIIGDGQTAEQLATDITNQNNIRWIRKWLPQEQLATEFIEADICLGVFGETEKCRRVWPFKNYLAMATGKPIISTHVDSSVLQEVTKFYYPVQPNNPKSLAEAILTMTNPHIRERYSRLSATYYNKRLSNEHALNLLHETFVNLLAVAPGPELK